MTYTLLRPTKGLVVQIDSSTWYVYTGELWRLMDLEEQLEFSL